MTPDRTKVTTVRLPLALHDELELLARAEDKSVSVVIREALAEYVTTKKKDAAFQQRLRERLEADAVILQRLAQ